MIKESPKQQNDMLDLIHDFPDLEQRDDGYINLTKIRNDNRIAKLFEKRNVSYYTLKETVNGKETLWIHPMVLDCLLSVE